MIYSFFLKNLVGEKLSGRRGRKKEKERERVQIERTQLAQCTRNLVNPSP